FPKAKKIDLQGIGEINVYQGDVLITQRISLNDTSDLPNAQILLNYYASNGDSLIKNADQVSMKFDLSKAPETLESEEKKSFWGIFILAFIGGLLALLTPCVFPMIPLTVTFFTKQSKRRGEGIRKALLYSLSII